MMEKTIGSADPPPQKKNSKIQKFKKFKNSKNSKIQKIQKFKKRKQEGKANSSRCTTLSIILSYELIKLSLPT